jgi:tRNA (adenine37-N6)-methyltransferase
MEILGLTFLGTSTPRRAEMTAFLRDRLGLEPSNIDGADLDAFRLPDGSTFVVTSPGERDESRRTVGFRVSDIDRACEAPREAGIASESAPAANSRFRYAHFRAPDGCLYELVEELPGTAQAASPVELLPAVAGLEEFSHVEVVIHLHRVAAGSVQHGARHPRGREGLPAVGILAQRAKRRPNRLGLSSCRLLSVRGLALDVEGGDAIDGTPILDIKPYFKGFEPRGRTREPVGTADVMADYFTEGPA